MASPHSTEYIVFLLSYKFIPKILFPFQTYPERKFQVSVSALNCSEKCLSISAEMASGIVSLMEQDTFKNNISRKPRNQKATACFGCTP